ncbi:YSIRK-type signal peptide-containing protein [Helcococcus bovis]|uniref:endo-beta-N-acetylglucosaminidase n=1 Tax=Helcococcus bovis TaxID=3153252 RepID=UPI0038BD8063
MDKMKNFLKEKKTLGNKKLKYGMRKLSIGLVSCVLGALVFLPGTSVLAEGETPSPTAVVEQAQDEATEDEEQEGDLTEEELYKLEIAEKEELNKDLKDKSVENVVEQKDPEELKNAVTEEKVDDSKTEEKIENLNEVKKEETKSKTLMDKLVGEKSEEEKAKENKTEEEIVEEIGDKVSKRQSLDPKPVVFSYEDIEKSWKPDERPNDDINKASVRDVAKTEKGKAVNEYASEEAMILPLTSFIGNKKTDASAAGSKDFNVNNFDKYQYVSDIVFWEGPVPTPDVIDAAHRNGSRIHGNLYFDNFDGNPQAMKNFLEFIKKDQKTGRYPNAYKLAEIAVHYGFDGYFMNQEVAGWQLNGKISEMREFFLQMKQRAKELGRDLKISWYDSWGDQEGGHNFKNRIGSDNDDLLKPDKEGKYAVDYFFINFNWAGNTSGTVAHMKSIGRSEFDAAAGYEMQKDVRLSNKSSRQDMLGKDKKLRISIGLYHSDNVNGLAKTEDDIHKVINDFWTGSAGDPTKIDDNAIYNGMARYVVDRTTILSPELYTRFSRGNGHKWFTNGVETSSDNWNNRSIQDVLPTWTWWNKSELAEKDELKADYDYTDAYNGGSSIKLEGKLIKGSKQDLRLFSTKFDPTKDTEVTFVYKGGKGSDIELGISTNEDHLKSEFKYLKPTVVESNGWNIAKVSLADLVGQKIYALSIKVDGKEEVENYKLNIGEFSITDKKEKNIESPKNIKEVERVINSGINAELILKFDKVKDAKYYDIYRRTKDGEKWLSSSSSSIIYIPELERELDSDSTIQHLSVYAIGKDGQKSDAGDFVFNWGILTNDTEPEHEKAKDINREAKITDADGPNDQDKWKLINGTMVGLEDKWEDNTYNSQASLAFESPKTVVRWAVNHAGFLESQNDGKMNSSDFALEYKDLKTGDWKEAKRIKNNIYHRTDEILQKPITAKEWRLKVYNGDNGSPWKATRIYGWEMYEALDEYSENVPMSRAEAVHVKDDRFVVKFNVPTRPFAKKFFAPEPNKTVYLYKDRELKNKLAEGILGEDGKLVFDNIRLQDSKGIIYYVSKVGDKKLSNRLAIQYYNPEKLRQEKWDTIKNAMSGLSQGLDDSKNKKDDFERERQLAIIADKKDREKLEKEEQARSDAFERQAEEAKKVEESKKDKESSSKEITVPGTDKDVIVTPAPSRTVPTVTPIPGTSGSGLVEKELPEFQYGENQVFVKGSGKQLEVKVESPLASFKEARVDSVVVDPSNYKLKSGSTIFTLKNAYLETLALGKHKLDLVFAESDEYKASVLTTKFTVVEAVKGKSDAEVTKPQQDVKENVSGQPVQNANKTSHNPETADAGIASYLAMAGLSAAALAVTKRRKNK